MSIEPEQYIRLKNKIYSDLNVKVFTINYWDSVTTVPHEIGLLQKLEHFNIYKNKQIKQYPQELADLPKLHIISLQYNNLKQIPLVLGEIPKLDTLILSYNCFNSTTKWDLFPKMKSLEHLDLSYSLQNLSELPSQITEIKKLKSLNLAGNKLQSIPSKLQQLTCLEKLNLEANNFIDFPIVVTQMKRLKELQIPAKSIENLNDEILNLQHIPKLIFTAKSNKITPYVYIFERLLKNIKTYKLSKESQLFFMKILRGDLTIKDLDNSQLVRLLNCTINEYTHEGLTEINKRIKNNKFGVYRLPSNSDKIVIKGKIKGKVSELKTRLWGNGIQTGSKINKTTTHILIGTMPNLTYEEIQTSNLVLITEQLLIAHLNKIERPYLLTKTEDVNLENIRKLLHSDHTENILLALEMLKGGGFPMELLTEIFLIYKFSRVQKIKRNIQHIIGQYAPLSFTTALKSRKSITYVFSEITRRRNLEFFCKEKLLDKKYIAFYLLEKGYHSHLFALFNLSTKDKQEYFSKVMKDGHLSLSGLELTELPEDLGKLKGLKHLDISYNKFNSLPSVLFECNELESLYIRGLYGIQKNHDELWKIKSLNTIYVGYNNKWIGYRDNNSITIKGKIIISR
ncbi:MAG: leucine-rich repeat domain-containing protein [Saprospiraceae bacterium]|nr:leucine-rich repeat domain-containing protein [Saprospiraceae bacterium]